MMTLKEIAAAGFRVLPIAGDGSKKPLVDGFGKENPEFTVAPDSFQTGDLIGFLTGPCPAFDNGDWLAVLDLDGETTLDRVADWVGQDLPETLSSKCYRHFYFRVPDSDLRAAIRAWVRIFGRADGAPECDLKWHGGYAIEKIEPGWWDEGGFAPERIATLPEAWLRRVLELRTANPYAGDVARGAQPAGSGQRVDMGDVPVALAEQLGAVWPLESGRHESALALGGILADSWWSEDDIARFAGAVFLASGTKNRTADVLYSVNTRRTDPKAECKGWPILKANLKTAGRGDYAAALKVLKDQVPGLKAPKVVLPDLTADGKVIGKPGLDSGLSKGSDVEIAEKIGATEKQDGAPGLVFDEGEFWRYSPDAGVWLQVPRFELSRAVDAYDGKVYDYTDKGRPIWVKLGSGRTASILSKLADQHEQPGFFANAPTGLAFANGFLRLNRDATRTFEPLTIDHRARHLLPCSYDPAATPRAPNWANYLRSIWGSDTESIRLVHQLLGYLLSGRHDMQKIFVLVGPPRAGKGTLLNLIHAIFRDQCGPFKVASLDGQFNMQGMLGKSVCFDPDVRRAGSMFKSEGQIVERLLSISAHDVQNIPRKNQQDVHVALGARLLLAANPPFGLTDVGGALASRFIILRFPRSFLGAEDRALGDRLAAEIPAIIALALDGLDQLNVVGRFIEPASSADERASIERGQNPMVAFLEECCDLSDPDAMTAKQVIWTAAVRWREEQGHRRMSGQAFAEFLRQHKVTELRPTDPEDSKKKLPRVFKGIKLQPRAEPAAVGAKKDANL